MNHGERSFLTTRPAKEAWPTVLRLFKEERWLRMNVAKRLDISTISLKRWLVSNGLEPKLAKERAAALARAVK